MPISFRIFQFIVIHTIKGFGIVNKAEIDVFLELSCSFNDPEDVGNLLSGSSAFSKTSLNIWKFTVHVQLKPGLENFEHRRVQLFASPQTIQFVEFSRPEFWSGQPFPSLGDLPNPGIELQADSLPAEPRGKPKGSHSKALHYLSSVYFSKVIFHHLSPHILCFNSVSLFSLFPEYTPLSPCILSVSSP